MHVGHINRSIARFALVVLTGSVEKYYYDRIDDILGSPPLSFNLAPRGTTFA